MQKFENKMVIAVRKDLKLTSGKLAAQVAHAAVNCALASKKKRPEWFERWYAEGQKKVVVKVASLEELLRLKVEAEDAGLVTSLITDAGLTELPQHHHLPGDRPRPGGHHRQGDGAPGADVGEAAGARSGGG